ncbi:helix-turn-helix transcriptional regulator [Sphingomonas sp.]|uniref:S24 family peptidase n=1 Tax=Sphingomonas sp. TaxID=28214 RepID=UPI0035BC8FA1
MSADQRHALVALAQARGHSLAALSAMLRRNPAYLQQFVARGTPRVLAERDRRLLADVFGVEDAALGGEPARAIFRVPRLDVAASAGPGAQVDDDVAIGTETLPEALARDLGLRAGQAGVIRVRGSSMEPALRDGDHLVVDQADRSPKARSAIYVIRVDGAVMVKRVARTSAGLVATSDNPVASPVPAGAIEVIGRVVWRMGRPE